MDISRKTVCLSPDISPYWSDSKLSVGQLFDPRSLRNNRAVAAAQLQGRHLAAPSDKSEPSLYHVGEHRYEISGHGLGSKILSWAASVQSHMMEAGKSVLQTLINPLVVYDKDNNFCLSIQGGN